MIQIVSTDRRGGEAVEPACLRQKTDTVEKLVALRSGQDSGCTTEKLWKTVERFASWLEKAGYASHDPYDIWGTRYGLWARRLYYAKHPLGVALTAPVIAMEMLCPSLRAWFVEKNRYATADAQLILAFLNLHELTGGTGGGNATNRTAALLEVRRKEVGTQSVSDPMPKAREEESSTCWLAKAKSLAQELLGYSVPGYSGYCWGYPFDWQNVNGLARRGTPFITTTPYCFEAFSRLFDISGEAHYLRIARSVADFVCNNLIDTPAGENAAAGSYGPYDSSKVVNASAYRAYVLFEAAHRLGSEAYSDKAWQNLRFILQSQRSDGSWLYAVDTPREAFIDHFHTCFVLKNLYKINLRLRNASVSQAIKSGFAYYRRELFDGSGLPKSYAVQPRLQIVRLEMYNIAEAISLGALLRAEIPEAFAIACSLARRLFDDYQLNDGHFVTRVYLGGRKHTLPFLRWPQAQLFHALTNLLRTLVLTRAVESAPLPMDHRPG